MASEIVNKPRISRLIGWGYIALTIIISAVMISILLSIPFPNNAFLTSFLFMVFMGVPLLLLGTTIGLYRTEYLIKEGVLYSWSPFVVIKLRLRDIKSVEKTIVPVHLRVGASSYCGFFYVPEVGWVRSIITNFNDGLMIFAKDGKKYLITPSEPDKFARMLRRNH
jgi:hypothetical protein